MWNLSRQTFTHFLTVMSKNPQHDCVKTRGEGGSRAVYTMCKKTSDLAEDGFPKCRQRMSYCNKLHKLKDAQDGPVGKWQYQYLDRVPSRTPHPPRVHGLKHDSYFDQFQNIQLCKLPSFFICSLFRLSL